MKGHIIVAAILAGIAFAPPESSQAQPNRRSNQNFRRYPPPPPPPPPGYRPPIQVFTLPNIQPSPQKTLGIATYRAVENEKLITLTATGQNATSGYQNLLEARTTTGSALSYNFVQVLPVGPVTQIGPVKQKATPFSVSFTFKPRKPARVVWVYDARGRQRVRVEVAPKRPAALQASISPSCP